jgi:uncharacterized protein YkwD
MMLRTRLLLAALFTLFCAIDARAEITFAIGEPAEGSRKSGVGLISGWAVSDRGIVSVEAFIDGESLGLVPYGSIRGDVAEVFPHIPDSLNSGWGMKWAYPLHPDGEHVLTIVVTEQGGVTASRSVTYEVVGFDTDFITDPAAVRTAGAVIDSPQDGRIVVTGAEILGRPVDFELAWDTASQQFLVDTVRYPDQPRANQAPSADAGPDRTVETGEAVSLTGHGSDPDGAIVSRRWSQVSGPTVALRDAGTWTVAFDAPATAGTVRLRLTVTDDGGLVASDDVLVVVEAPPAANVAPQADAGPDFTVESGAAVSITGNGSDPDGGIVGWNWLRAGGLPVTLRDAATRTVRFTAPTGPGEVRLWLRVTDDDGATDTDEVTVTVLAPPQVNQAPTADAGPDRTVETGAQVTLAGGASDPDGTIAAWSWQQVDGPAVALSGAASREVTFTAPGQAATLRLRLTVTDDDGASASDDVLVTVQATAEPDATTGGTLASMMPYINEARASARLCGTTEFPAQPPLQWSDSLAEIAMIHSMDMARQGYFSHTSLDGTSMGDRVFPYWSGRRVGENIAASSIDRSDAYIVQLWLDSPGHCALIMDPNFTHAGIGVGRNPDNGYDFHHFWTLDFGG